MGLKASNTRNLPKLKLHSRVHYMCISRKMQTNFKMAIKYEEKKQFKKLASWSTRGLFYFGPDTTHNEAQN